YQRVAQRMAGALGWVESAKARFDDREDLRRIILKKNQLFFNRWRPENSTYLFLFRKHEQGRNAQEIPQFDPLVQAEEANIAKLRREPAKAVRSARSSRDGRTVTASSSDDTVRIWDSRGGRKPKQIPVTEHPATPVREQP